MAKLVKITIIENGFGGISSVMLKNYFNIDSGIHEDGEYIISWDYSDFVTDPNSLTYKVKVLSIDGVDIPPSIANPTPLLTIPRYTIICPTNLFRARVESFRFGTPHSAIIIEDIATIDEEPPNRNVIGVLFESARVFVQRIFFLK